MSRFILILTTLLSVAHADVFVPGPKVAGIEDAWSLYTNTAGISYVDGAQFVGGYAYRISSFDNGRHLAEGSLALNVFEGLSLGTGLRLSLPNAQVGDDQGVIGGALGLAYRYQRFIALGARVEKTRQYKNASSDPFRFGLGIESFPVSWLSLGASVFQVYDDIWSKPEIRAGIAIKSSNDMLIVSAETLLVPNDNYAVYPELSARLDLGGFSLLTSVRASDVTKGFSAPTIFAGLEINFDHIGFGIISQGHPTDEVSVGGRFRLSSETWPPLAPKRERIVMTDSQALLNGSSLALKE